MQKTWGFFNPKFLGEGNHLAVFPEASDLHEVQQQPVKLQEVNVQCTIGCVDFEIFLIFNLGLIIFDGDGYSNGHKSQKNNFQIYLDPPQID